MNLLSQLNPQQREAVQTTEGPLLILAGAGSGKTRTIIHRIAYILQQGLAYPSEILAITFTNKAAGEMRERIGAMNVPESTRIWIHTFHAMCGRILRQHGQWLGYDRNFVIYDTDDQKKLYKEISKAMQLDDKRFSFGLVMGKVSDAKDHFLTPQAFASQLTENDFIGKRVAAFYTEYQKRLKANNAMDFDDLIFNTIRLFQEQPQILAQYQHRFKYLMVDEYQDTNHAQYLLVELLSQETRNLCVCGDDDQSIYGWRGADITNILDFENAFPDAKVIKLEQNYRSTKPILEAANAVIAHNRARKVKALWTQNPGDDRILVTCYASGYEEARGIAEKIQRLKKEGTAYGDVAILYRTNAQSRLFEEAFLRSGIPYQLVGGTGFYARQEIKDIMSYLHVIVNPKDDLGCMRIINMPKRGIGGASIEKLREYAEYKGISLFEAAMEVRFIPTLSGGTASKIQAFADLMNRFQSIARTEGVADLLRNVIQDSGYQAMLEENKMENSESRLENLQELVSSAAEFERTSDDSSVTAFLETIALASDTDQYDDQAQGKVLLMTLHCAKGLEFAQVFMPGMETGLFPTMTALMSGRSDAMEEERRICYVGITRAQKRLYMSWAKVRTLYGNTEYRRPSEFLDEIPMDLIQMEATNQADCEQGLKTGNGIRNDRSSFSENHRFKTGGLRDLTHSTGLSNRKKEMVRESGSNNSETAFNPGDKIDHKKFGQGTIVQVDGDHLTIAFPGIGIKKLKTAYVERV